ncbi:MAG: hypothetical protein OEM96_06850, partial [Gemmatimonadota bacterium]|nr:hypothetical protein [Gemmatimonadota bacterium]
MTAGRPALAGLAMLASVAAPAAAQRSIATERDTVRFELAALRVMLDTARALRQDLEDDPRVLYSL